MITLALVVFDVLAINLSYLFALWFRFDCRASMIPMHYLDGWLRSAPAFTIVTIILFAVMRLYSSLWQFAGSNELVRAVHGGPCCDLPDCPDLRSADLADAGVLLCHRRCA